MITEDSIYKLITIEFVLMRCQPTCFCPEHRSPIADDPVGPNTLVVILLNFFGPIHKASTLPSDKWTLETALDWWRTPNYRILKRTAVVATAPPAVITTVTKGFPLTTLLMYWTTAWTRWFRPPSFIPNTHATSK